MEYFQILSCSSDLGNCCNNPGIVVILDNLRRIFNLVQLIVPILLIVFAVIKFSQLVMDPDRKNGLKEVKNSFLAAAIVFFLPVFMDAVLTLIPNTFSVSACWDTAKVSAETYRSFNFKYVSYDEAYKNKEKSKIINSGDGYEAGDPVEDDGGSGGTVAAGDAQGILDGAKKVHTMYEKNGWAYYTSLGQLRWNDINYSTNNPSKMTCCATFVGSAFYVGGVFSEAEINKYNYNSQYGIDQLCQAHNWTKITSYSQLAAGDIVIMSGPSGGSAPGHVQIYAGNGTWYNAGSTNAIQRENPYSSDASGRFLWAWRKTS